MPSSRIGRAREYAKARRAIEDAKSTPCADCGIQYPWWVMDFDHRSDSDKLFNIGATRHVGHNKLLREIAKCDVVCANCHRLRHPPKVSGYKAESNALVV